MGLKCGGIKGLEGLGRVDWVVGKKYRRCSLGVGMEESQLLSEFADCPFS